MLFHRGIENGQLADERAKGRRAGHREEPGQEQGAGPRDAPERPRHVLDVLAVVGPVDVPGREEHHALDDPVVQHVQEGAEDTAAAEAETERQNSHVLDARIRQHALQVSLTDREHAGDGHGEEPEHDQDAPSKCSLSRGGQNVKDPGKSEEGAARQGAGHQGAHDPRRLAIRVGLPRMHGGQSHLRSIPDHEQHEGGLQPGLRESRRVADEVIEQQRGVASRLHRGIPQEERLAFSAHKMLGPTGVGVLWAKEDLLETMDPLHVGSHMIKTVTKNKATWADLPDKFEAGTGNLEGVVGLSASISYLKKIGWEKIASYENELTKYALEKLKNLPFLKLYGPKTYKDRLGIFSFNITNAHAHDIAQILDGQNIAIRSGHHCAQITMQALGVPATARASLYLYNTKEDVDRLVEGINVVKKTLKI